MNGFDRLTRTLMLMIMLGLLSCDGITEPEMNCMKQRTTVTEPPVYVWHCEMIG